MFPILLNAIFLKWPYFIGCLIFAVTTPFALVLFDLKWWIAVLLGGAIFAGWILMGLLLQVAYGESQAENAKVDVDPKGTTSEPP